jgi:predicted nucleotidyltransferase component of viral defense system
MSEIKDMAASVRTRLLRIAKQEKRDFDQIILLYMQERLLYRISQSKYAGNLCLKGGLLLYNVLGLRNRPTLDIDFLARNISNDGQRLQAVFQEIVAVFCNDGLVFHPEGITVGVIAHDADYQGKRVKIPCNLGVIPKCIQIDLGFSDIVIPRPREMRYPVLLDDSIIPNIMCYSIDSVVAEKFEAMVKLSDLNSRMKDFFDVFGLLSTQKFDGRVLQEAITETFSRRRTPLEKELYIFTGEFKTDSNKQKQWQAFLDKLREPLSYQFSEIVSRIENFIDPVWKEICCEGEFFGSWNFELQIWKL